MIHWYLVTMLLVFASIFVGSRHSGGKPGLAASWKRGQREMGEPFDLIDDHLLDSVNSLMTDSKSVYFISREFDL